ncbi:MULTISPECIES: lipoprotein [unclassified Streptomyces]|uniref:lipoprotein n=1 Tax=unclassified Streptomyces TaxID=2593676 RepID=UPI0004C3C339
MPRAPFLRTALLASVLLTAGACGTTPEPDPSASAAPSSATSPSATPSATPSAARAAGSLGGPGTPCALPVSFSLAEDWEPKAVEVPADPDFADLVKQGPATIVCEANAKATGNLGFLRVWSAPKGPAGTTLRAFVKAEKGSKGLTLADLKTGGTPIVEARYTVHSELLDEDRAGRAFAVETARSTVVVELGGFDAEEDAMIAAYELARSSLKVT